MALQLQYERMIEGIAPPQVLAAIHQWLLEERSVIKSAQPPVRIQATHGSAWQWMSWREDAKKTLAFELAPTATGTAVPVTAVPPALNASDVQMRLEVTRENWARLLDRLWARFGSADVTHPAVRTPAADWSKAAREAKWTMLASPVVGVAGLLGALSVSALLGPSRSNAVIAIPLIGAALAFMMGFWRWRDAPEGMARSGGAR